MLSPALRGAALALTLAAAASGCGSTSTVPDSGTPVVDAGDDCPSGQVRCAGECVDTSTSVWHCGACRNFCIGTQECKSGSCVDADCRVTGTCPTGQFCNPEGSCKAGCAQDSHCAADEACNTADAVCVCKAGSRRCITGGPCVPDATECPKPECGTGSTLCAGACVDVWSDPRHCGGCGVACRNGEVCRGTCQASPDCTTEACPGLTYCDATLKVCKPGCSKDSQCHSSEKCDTGTNSCVCPNNQHRCSGVCLSRFSPLSCGSSCTPCPLDPNGAATCDGTQCGIQCRAGYQFCGGRCIPENTVNACGPSCATCPGGANGEPLCSAGACTLRCNPGYQLCGTTCVPVDSVSACGASCTTCPSVSNGAPTCKQGACGVQCAPGFQLCGGKCVACPPGGSSYTCDAQNACVISSCGSAQKLCSAGCATCPTQGTTASACSGDRCVATSCTSGHRLCADTCAACPSAGATSLTCSGAHCVAETCETGRTLCDGNCSTCPSGGGIATTGCSGTACVPQTCATGYRLCSDTCSPCPTAGVTATSCSGAVCVATACSVGFRPCASGCCPWQVQDVTSGASVSGWSSNRPVDVGFDSSNRMHLVFYKHSTKTVEYRSWADASGWELQSLGDATPSAVDLVMVSNQPHVVTHRRTSVVPSPTVSFILHHRRVASQQWVTSTVNQTTANPYIYAGAPSLTLNGSGGLTVLYWGDASPAGLVSVTGTTTGTGWVEQSTGVQTTFAQQAPVVWSGGPRALLVKDYWVRLVSGPGVLWSSQQVDGSLNATPALAVGTSGTLHAAYVHSQGLRYARQTSATTWMIQTVDSTASADSVSLAVDRQGRPHLAYYAGATQDLKYATWNGSSWLLSTVDATGSVGWYPAIALDANDVPNIVYYDATRSYLKHAKAQ